MRHTHFSFTQSDAIKKHWAYTVAEKICLESRGKIYVREEICRQIQPVELPDIDSKITINNMFRKINETGA